MGLRKIAMGRRSHKGKINTCRSAALGAMGLRKIAMGHRSCRGKINTCGSAALGAMD
jgi:hypothetical protein